MTLTFTAFTAEGIVVVSRGSVTADTTQFLLDALARDAHTLLGLLGIGRETLVCLGRGGVVHIKLECSRRAADADSLHQRCLLGTCVGRHVALGQH